MARKKVKKKKVIKPEEEANTIFKTVKGKRTKFVNVNLRKSKKTINKQYKYRGGKFSTYISEAKLPKGTLYYVNYRENRIITNPEEVDALVKRVKRRRKEAYARGKKKPKKKDTKTKILKEFKIIRKRIPTPPMPIEATKIIPKLDGKIYYEREHSVMEFATMSQNDNFLINILRKATRSRREAVNLMHNFHKIKLKMSYAVLIEGMNKDTGMVEAIGKFTAIGKKPIEIVEFLKSVNLMPTDDYIDLYEDVIRPFKNKLDSNGVYFNEMGGNYRITDVRMAIKFYNNPQKQLK